MNIASKILVGFVAVEHLFILVLEMFLWQSELGLKIFKMTPEVASASATLAKNQGLYNGFLAAGLIWALGFISDKSQKYDTTVFFLGCIIVAAIFGAITAKPSIIISQGSPAIIALVVTYLANKK